MNYCQSFCRTIQRMANVVPAPEKKYYITLTTSAGNRTIGIQYDQSVANAATIYWGDGASTATGGSTGTSQQLKSHTYSDAGEYVITIDVAKDISSFNLRSTTWNTCGVYDTGGGSNLNVTAIYIPDGVSYLAGYVFAAIQKDGNGNVAKDIRLPDTLRTIGYWALRYVGATSWVFPESLQTIGEQGNYNNRVLTSVTFPAGITSIGKSAFEWSGKLASITFTGQTPPTIGSNAFNGIATAAIVYVPVGTSAAYTAAFASTGLQSKTIIEV